MSESLITDQSRAFCSEDWCLLPFAWLREGEEEPPAQPGSWGAWQRWRRWLLSWAGWRWVPVPPDQPDPESIIIIRRG